jgi:radical SAM protein with 4Fe4S-binding SPASM domain
MDLATACNIINQYNPYKIIFFGGEPLIEIDLIEQLLQIYPDKTFQLITSLTINVDRFINLCKTYSNLKELQISWDGWNDNRIDQHNQSIAQLVYNNIQILINHNIHFDIKAVISEKNVGQLTDLHQYFLNLRKYNVYGQFVFAHRTDYTNHYFDILKEQLGLTFDLNYLYREHANRIIGYLSNKLTSTCDIGKYIVIDAYNRISYCTALSHTDFDMSTNEIYQSINQPCSHSDCIQCLYRYMCDGGCRYERYIVYKDQWQSNYLLSTCKFMKIYHDTIESFLHDLSDQDKLHLYKLLQEYEQFLKRMKGEKISC